MYFWQCRNPLSNISVRRKTESRSTIKNTKNMRSFKKNIVKPLGASKNGDVFFLTGLFFSALLVRLVYLWQYSHAPDFCHPAGDAGFFCDEAWKIVRSGKLFGDDVPFQSPAYPMILALFFKLAGSNYFLPRLVQVVIGSLNCLVVYTLTTKASPEKVWPARIAGIVTALYGTLVFFEGNLLMISFTLFFANISLLGLIFYREKNNLCWPIMAGTCFALAAVDRTNMLLFVPVAVWFLWKGTGSVSWCRRIQSVILYVTGMLIVILPFTIHNYRVSGDIVLISSNAGINLFIGNNPYAPGIFAIPPDIPIRNHNIRMAEDVTEIACKERGKKLKPSEVSRYWALKARNYIVSHPLDAARLYVKKTSLMFNWREIPNHLDFIFIKKEVTPWLSYLFIGFWIVAPLAFVGIVGRLLLGMNAVHKLFIMFICMYTLSLLPFFINDRYRLPIVPFLVIFASVALADLRYLILNKKWRILLIQAAVFVAVYLFVNQMLVSGFNKQSRLVMAEKYAQRAFSEKKVKSNDLEKAIQEYSQVIEAAPYYPTPYWQLAELYEKIGWYSGGIYMLGAMKDIIPATQSDTIQETIDRLKQLYEQFGDKINGNKFSPTGFEQAIYKSENGDYMAAERLLREVIAKDVEHSGAWIYLSRLYLSKKDTSTAIRTLERAWKNNPQELHILKELLNTYQITGNLKKYCIVGKKLKGFLPPQTRNY